MKESCGRGNKETGLLVMDSRFSMIGIDTHSYAGSWERENIKIRHCPFPGQYWAI
jgi:hypothetical protein